MILVGTISERFAISGRGVAVFFVESPKGVTQAGMRAIVVERPDGNSLDFRASRAFVRKAGAPGSEVIALLVEGAQISDLEIGSKVYVALGREADC